VNLLSPVVQDKPDYFSLAQFELLHNDKECSLEFITLKSDSDDFNLLLKMSNSEKKRQHKSLSNFLSELNIIANQQNISESSGHSLVMLLGSYLENIKNIQIFLDSLQEMNTKDEYLTLITRINTYYNNELLMLEKFQPIIVIKQFDCKISLVCKTVENPEFLKDIATHIYLAAPSTQIFLFLSSLAKQALFSTTTSYNEHVNKAKKKLPELFTYDFAPIKIIIDAFVKARDKDFTEALEVGGYGNNLQNLRTDLDSFFFGKSITVNKELTQVIFKLKETDEELSPEDLSHGELKKLGIYVWLKYQGIENALVLMDEIEIGLHPDWQYEIANELQEWSHGNQFILATHSYELCQALTPSHVKELSPKLIK
jgi:predicted ATPase